MNRTLTITSHSPVETRALAARLGRRLKAGDMVLLIAPLGGGKTTFAQGVLHGAGVRGGASSPTFVVAQSFDGRITVHHLDFYRMKKRELLAVGIDDYLLGRGAVGRGAVLIEWADVFPECWPADRLEVRIAIPGAGDERRLAFSAHGPRAGALLTVLRGKR